MRALIIKSIWNFDDNNYDIRPNSNFWIIFLRRLFHVLHPNHGFSPFSFFWLSQSLFLSPGSLSFVSSSSFPRSSLWSWPTDFWPDNWQRPVVCWPIAAVTEWWAMTHSEWSGRLGEWLEDSDRYDDDDEDDKDLRPFLTEKSAKCIGEKGKEIIK